jgi:hypothetical protein
MSATKPNWLILFRGKNRENHTKHASTLYGQKTEIQCVKANDMCSNEWALKS